MMAARHLKKTILELGGSDPFLVMPSADLDTVVPAAVRSRLHCNGQACTAAKRFIVDERIADAFERRFITAMQRVRCGDPFDERTELGPLATPSVADTLERQVRESIRFGARMRTGGRIDDTLFAPTVLTDVPRFAPVAREETFGPLAAVFRARDVEHAIEIANDSRFGLGASIWTSDRNEASRCVDRLEAGQVSVNAIVTSDPSVPFGGIKDSGFGREMGVFGMRELTSVKAVRARTS